MPIIALTRLALAMLVVIAAWLPWLDNYAEEWVDDGLKRTLVAFAVARGLNGVISVAQGTTVAVQPVGIGVSLSPGELLDPINDLVEQFADVMLLASVSLGIQKLLLVVSGWWVLAAAITVLLAALIVAEWRRRAALPRGAPATSLLRTTLMVLLMVRFAVPACALLSEGAYGVFLDSEYRQSSAALENAEQKITQSVEQDRPVPGADTSWLERAEKWLDSTAAVFDIEQRIAALRNAAREVAENVVDLIAVFVLQTLLFPLLFLGLSAAIVRRATLSLT